MALCRILHWWAGLFLKGGLYSTPQHGQAPAPPSLSVHTLAALLQSPYLFTTFTQLLYMVFLSATWTVNVFRPWSRGPSRPPNLGVQLTSGGNRLLPLGSVPQL